MLFTYFQRFPNSHRDKWDGGISELTVIQCVIRHRAPPMSLRTLRSEIYAIIFILPKQPLNVSGMPLPAHERQGKRSLVSEKTISVHETNEYSDLVSRWPVPAHGLVLQIEVELYGAVV